jgi:hypothetical protein
VTAFMTPIQRDHGVNRSRIALVLIVLYFQLDPPVIRGGFDMAILTCKKQISPIDDVPLYLTETDGKERLFLISNTDSYETNNGVFEGGAKKPKRTINRKRIIYGNVFAYNNLKYQINSAKSGLYIEILTAMVRQFEITRIKWGRVFVLRFDLHTHRKTKNNKLMTDFRKRLFQRLKREYGFKEIGFCWVREQERAKAQHYHWVLFLDGDLVRHSSRINEIVKESWEKPCGNFHVPTIKRPFYFADSHEVVKKAIYRISYLAKPRGKGYRDKQTKDYQCSRMKVD